MKKAPYNVEGFRRQARRALPGPIFDFVDGGAEDEVTLRANRAAFESIRLVPRVLTGAGTPDLSTTLCGQPLSMPLMLAPTGASGLCHPLGELAAALAANRQATIAFMSTAATYTIEEIAAAASPAPWFQLYPSVDRDFYLELMRRAAAAGFPGLCVTVDTAVVGRRERDYANGLVIPPTLQLRNIPDFLRRPRWGLDVLRHRRVVVKAFAPPGKPTLRAFLGNAASAAQQFTGGMAPFAWRELEEVRTLWEGPLAVKGILSPDDARRAVDVGAQVIVVSNHGGRQLDGAPASIEALPGVVAAVDGKAEIVLDSGIRRGSDVVKALSLGARACMIGRPWLYGLAAGGTDGVVDVLAGLRTELEVVMALLGAGSVTELSERNLLLGPRQA